MRPITSEQLIETGAKQRRWMSLPESRIVVNPYRFGLKNYSSEQSDGPDLPLNLGYYANGEGYFIDKILTVVPEKVSCVNFETSWMPHQLSFNASYSDAISVKGFDFFYDETTFVRALDISESTSGVTIGGQYTGDITLGQNTIVVQTEHYIFAIASPCFAMESFHEDSVEKRWEVMLDPEHKSEIYISLGLATPDEGPSQALGRANRPFEQADIKHQRQVRLQQWNEYLKSVPHPKDFSLNGVDAMGVTEEDVRKAYYKAWAFLHMNLLPVMKETGFDFPQQPTGKPSMWLEGHPLAKPCASWESFFGMQFYAFYDSESAWRCFEGMMSLVDEEGMLAGESLPSRKAQTAYILYSLTKDKERLEAVYPALKRYLLWREENPRWIYGEHDNPAERDADFVSSAIVDMGYLLEICQILDLGEEAELWRQKRLELFDDYLRWFWESPQSIPGEYYFADSGDRVRGNDLWMCNGLYLNMLKPPYTEGMFGRFYNGFDSEKPFCGFALPKYPELSFLAYALIDRGKDDEANILINTVIRDVCRANMFAEQYLTNDFPYPDGVRPSIFGLACLIDMVWLNNGVRIDRISESQLNGSMSH